MITIKLSIRDEAHAMALMKYCKRITFEDLWKHADACDGAQHRDAHAQKMNMAFHDLEMSLKEAGFSDR